MKPLPFQLSETTKLAIDWQRLFYKQLVNTTALTLFPANIMTPLICF